MLNIENLNYYREGHVVKETLDNLYCCHIAEVTKPVLEYLELVYNDGSRKFVYEDVEQFKYVEKNFHSKRFTSFFTLLTTDELAVEDRGFAQFEYYVRRDESDYIVMPLDEARTQLAGQKELPVHETFYNQYDTEVNYHLD